MERKTFISKKNKKLYAASEMRRWLTANIEQKAPDITKDMRILFVEGYGRTEKGRKADSLASFDFTEGKLNHPSRELSSIKRKAKKISECLDEQKLEDKALGLKNFMGDGQVRDSLRHVFADVDRGFLVAADGPTCAMLSISEGMPKKSRLLAVEGVSPENTNPNHFAFPPYATFVLAPNNERIWIGRAELSDELLLKCRYTVRLDTALRKAELWPSHNYSSANARIALIPLTQQPNLTLRQEAVASKEQVDNTIILDPSLVMRALTFMRACKVTSFWAVFLVEKVLFVDTEFRCAVAIAGIRTKGAHKEKAPYVEAQIPCTPYGNNASKKTLILPAKDNNFSELFPRYYQPQEGDKQ